MTAPDNFWKATAADLKIGDTFQLKPRTNGKQFTVKRDFEGHGPIEMGGPEWKGEVRPEHQGKLFMIVNFCRQLILDKTTTVFIITAQKKELTSKINPHAQLKPRKLRPVSPLPVGELPRKRELIPAKEKKIKAPKPEKKIKVMKCPFCKGAKEVRDAITKLMRPCTICAGAGVLRKSA